MLSNGCKLLHSKDVLCFVPPQRGLKKFFSYNCLTDHLKWIHKSYTKYRKSFPVKKHPPSLFSIVFGDKEVNFWSLFTKLPTYCILEENFNIVNLCWTLMSCMNQ